MNGDCQTELSLSFGLFNIFCCVFPNVSRIDILETGTLIENVRKGLLAYSMLKSMSLKC